MRPYHLSSALLPWACACAWTAGCAGDRAPVGEAMSPAIGASAAWLAEALVPDAAPPPPAAPLTAPPAAIVAPRPRLFQLTLRSTPAGAVVFVDGRRIGTTPARADVADDRLPHDFRFTLTGHEEWRLRFAPSRDGVIHATLQPTAGADAGPR